MHGSAGTPGADRCPRFRSSRRRSFQDYRSIRSQQNDEPSKALATRAYRVPCHKTGRISRTGRAQRRRNKDSGAGSQLTDETAATTQQQ